MAENSREEAAGTWKELLAFTFSHNNTRFGLLLQETASKLGVDLAQQATEASRKEVLSAIRKTQINVGSLVGLTVEDTMHPLSAESMHGARLLRTLWEDIRSAIEDNITTKDTKKTIARKVVALLQKKHQLDTAVDIDAFAQENHIAHQSEATKAAAQHALATQGAAALFALEVGLLEKTKQELERHIESMTTYASGQLLVDYSTQEFVEPLVQQLNTVAHKLQEARDRQTQAQLRFQELRLEATKPVMTVLKTENLKYQQCFAEIPEAEIDRFTTLVARLCEGSSAVVTQPTTPPATNQPAVDTRSMAYLMQLYRDAVSAVPKLQQLLADIKRNVQGMHTEVDVELGPIKGVERSVAKTVEEYGGDFSRLLDIARGTVVCPSIAAAITVVTSLGEIARNLGVRIVRVKNRLDPVFAAEAESGGYRDLLLNIQLQTGHVCELQVHLQQFVELKKSGGHKTYSIARTLHLLDSHLAQMRVSAAMLSSLDPNEDSVRPALHSVFESIERGSCQAVDLTHTKLSVREWKTLRSALSSEASNFYGLIAPFCGLEVEECSKALCGEHSSIESNVFPGVRVLNLMGNTKISAQCVVAFIGKELEVLNLRNCRLESEAFAIVCQALERHRCRRVRSLNLMGNFDMDGASDLAVPLRRMSGLQELQMYGNTMKPDGAKDLFESLATLHQLTTLRVSGTGLGAESVQFLSEALLGLKLLKTLAIDGNNIKAQGAQSLASSLGSLPLLTYLNIQGCNLEAEGMQWLATPLGELHQLNTLLIYNNHLGPEGATPFSTSLKNLRSLTSLNIYNNKFGPEGAKQLAAPLRELKLLTHLDASSNSFGQEGAKYLAEALNDITTLQVLKLSDNSFSAEGMAQLAPSLANLVMLKTLEIYGNQLGPEGSVHIANALSGLTGLEILLLANNEFGADGAKNLGQSLSNLHDLKHLSLHTNGFGVEGIKHLVTSLCSMPNLAELYLDNNNLGADGVAYLTEPLAQLKNLKTLGLFLNNLGPEGMATLKDPLSRLTTLTNLDLSTNELGVEGAKHLASSLASLNSIIKLRLDMNKFEDDGLAVLEPKVVSLPLLVNLDITGNKATDATKAQLKVRLAFVRALRV